MHGAARHWRLIFPGGPVTQCLLCVLSLCVCAGLDYLIARVTMCPRYIGEIAPLDGQKYAWCLYALAFLDHLHERPTPIISIDGLLTKRFALYLPPSLYSLSIFCYILSQLCRSFVYLHPFSLVLVLMACPTLSHLSLSCSA